MDTTKRTSRRQGLLREEGAEKGASVCRCADDLIIIIPEKSKQDGERKLLIEELTISGPTQGKLVCRQIKRWYLFRITFLCNNQQ